MVHEKTVLIIDDHPLFREGLKTIIARDDSFAVVGEAGSGKEGLELVKELKPNLIVMDILLPDVNGIELTREIRTLFPETRVMILSMHSKIDYISDAFRAGATGYVVKESATDRLLQGLKTVLEGGYFLDTSLSHKVVERLMTLPGEDAAIKDARYETLTPREQQVMGLLAEGLSVRRISEKLFISPKTVNNHRTHIMSKLGLHNTHELVKYAAKLGLIDVDLWKD
ncbi:MAG: response regulator transcription factor [Deltaproteobacteria bacterium]|nr:response regulator transcription factor [Deltaproteobacteria bacterium]